jgi:GNAT superfamily N-acetyltransferase
VSVVPEIVIRPLDPTDDGDMDGFQDVYAAAELAEDPEAALYSREDGVALMTSDSSELFDAFGAFVGDRMVGESILMGSTTDNLDIGWVLLWVHPEHRRRQVGTRLVEHMQEHARSRGRKILRAQARVGEAQRGNQVFAEHRGFTLAMTEIERRLRFPIDLDMLDRLATEAAPHHHGYEIRAVIGRTPDELRASYVDVRNLLRVEMPHGDLELETGRLTLDDFDAMERERVEAGRTSVTAYAVHDGTVVAYADASVPGGEFRHVDQYGTLVHPDHRGHRLGMAVKCAQLRALAEAFPDRAYIQTSNAEVNAHMVAINVALGFEIHQVWGEFEKRIVPVTTSGQG